MGVTITRPGVPVVTGKTSKFLAVNPNECIFTFNREDYSILEIVNSGGFAAIVVSSNITTELSVGDGVYFSSSKYTLSSSTIKSYSYSSGDNETSIVLNTTYAGSDDTTSGNYINLIDGRFNFKIHIEIFNADTLAPIVKVPGREPFSNGELKIDLSAFLRAQLNLVPEINYSLSHSPNKNNAIPFFIKYQISYGNTANSPVNDYPNIYTAIGAAQQIQTKYGSNMGEFVSFHNPALGTVPKGSWMSSFKQPTYWQGYPFGIGFCFQDEGTGSAVDMKRVIETLDNNGTVTNLSRTSMDESKMLYPNHVTVSPSGSYASNTDSLNLWIESGVLISQCGLLGLGSENAFNFQDWVLDGSNNLLGIKVDKNSSLVTSIDSRPDGSLYNELGTLMDTLSWSSGNSRYEPSGTHNINISGWYAVIPGIDVTLVPAYANEVCANQSFYQVSNGAANLAPTLSSIVVSGDLDTEGTLTATYTYSDNESDLQDVGATTEGFYSYTDSAGTIEEDFLGSGKTFNLSASHLNKYIRFKSTPAAQTGTTPGIEYQSSVYGPIVSVESFTFQTDFQSSDGTFDPSITYTGGGTPKWLFEDGSELTGASISTSGNGLDGTTQDVVLKVQSLANITAFTVYDDELIGTLDLSTLTGLTSLTVNDNNLTGLTLVASHDFTYFDIGGNTGLSIAGSHFAVPSFSSATFDAGAISITGTLIFKASSTFSSIELRSATTLTGIDLSNCTFSGGDSDEIDLGLISTCTSITFPSSSGGTIGKIRADGTGVSSLDVSGMVITRQFIFSNCTSLTTVTYGTQTNALTNLSGGGCTSLVGEQDISNFTHVPDYVYFDGSPIVDLHLPTSSNSISNGIYLKNCNVSTITNLENCTNLSDSNNFTLDVRNNSMTSGEVNVILDNFNTISGSGYTGRKVKIEGTNSDPTSGPPDGDGAVTNLTDNGFTVTTS